MKKNYQKPVIAVIGIELHQMIAYSEQKSFGSDVNTAEGADARRGTFWGDDDE